MDQLDYDDAHRGCSGPKSLTIRLLTKVFTREELARSNFRGGDVFTGKEWVTKESLKRKPAFQAIIAQVSRQFPGSTATTSFQKEIREAVNTKCRKVGHALRAQGP